MTASDTQPHNHTPSVVFDMLLLQSVHLRLTLGHDVWHLCTRIEEDLNWGNVARLAKGTHPIEES